MLSGSHLWSMGSSLLQPPAPGLGCWPGLFLGSQGRVEPKRRREHRAVLSTQQP